MVLIPVPWNAMTDIRNMAAREFHLPVRGRLRTLKLEEVSRH